MLHIHEISPYTAVIFLPKIEKAQLATMQPFVLLSSSVLADFLFAIDVLDLHQPRGFIDICVGHDGLFAVVLLPLLGLATSSNSGPLR